PLSLPLSLSLPLPLSLSLPLSLLSEGGGLVCVPHDLAIYVHGYYTQLSLHVLVFVHVFAVHVFVHGLVISLSQWLSSSPQHIARALRPPMSISRHMGSPELALPRQPAKHTHHHHSHKDDHQGVDSRWLGGVAGRRSGG
ncbi:hypothetical protein B484DRAFT_19969, partial [Ochromonadaceae sp. CCMP2298]